MVSENLSSLLTPLDRVKIISLLDYDKKIFPLKATKKHLELLEFISTEKRGCVCATRGFAKSSYTHLVFLPTEIIFSQKDMTIIVVMNSFDKATDWTANTREVLDRAISAGFKLKKGDTWGRSSFEVINEFGKVISIAASSPSKDIRGTNKKFVRPTLVICDDLESAAPNAQINATTKGGREKLNAYFFSDLLPSLSDNARVIVIGTILHKEGLINSLLNDPSFNNFEAPAIINGKSVWAIKMPLTKEDAQKLKEQYPNRKDIESIEEIRDRLILHGREDEFYREYLCKPFSDDSTIFRREFFKYFDGVIYENEIEEYTIQDSMQERKFTCKKIVGIDVGGEIIPLNKLDRYIAIDNASSGRDHTVMIACARYEDKLFVLEIRGGNRWSPFEKGLNLIQLLIEWKCNFGGESGGMQNEYFYIYKEMVARFRETFYNKGFYPNMDELKHYGKAKNVRIAQLEPLFRSGKILFNKKDPMLPYLENQLLDFNIDTDNRDDYPDALSYNLQKFGFIKFEDKKENFMSNNLLSF